VKKPLKIRQQCFSEAFVALIRQSGKKFDVPNQMSQTKHPTLKDGTVTRKKYCNYL